MTGKYSQTEDCEVLWKYRQVVCALCDGESRAMGEWNGLWGRSLQLPSYWMSVRQKLEKEVLQWEL